MNRRRCSAIESPDLKTTQFQVIGEHKVDPTLLLVLGTDGQCYVYFPDSNEVAEIDPDEDWEIYERCADVQPDIFTLGPAEARSS